MEPTPSIGIIGDFNPKNATHTATTDAIRHAAAAWGQRVVVEWISTRQLEVEGTERLSAYHGLWCSPGSPYQSMEGALAAIRFARETNRPFFGT
jgi:CTP synthase (UTP-ammonia lyase)